MPRRKQQAPKRLKGSEEDGVESGGDGEAADNKSESGATEKPTSSPKPDDTSDKDEPSEDEKQGSSASSPPSPVKEEQPTAVVVDAPATEIVKPATEVVKPATEDKLMEIKHENGIGVKVDCVATMTTKPELFEQPPPMAMISTKNEHLEKLKETLKFDMLTMSNKWRESSLKNRTSHRFQSDRRGPSAPDVSCVKRRPPPDAIQRLPESMHGEALRESLQSRRLPLESGGGGSSERLRETSLSKRSLGPLHPTEIPLKKHHKMPPSRPVYYSESDDSDEDYRHSFRGKDKHKFSNKLFSSRPPAPEQNVALDLTVKKQKDHELSALTTKIERHDDNCSKCEAGASQYVHNKLVKSVFCEAVPRDVLASVSRLQTDYSVLPSRVNLCRAVNGRCNFVVCTDCYQAFPNVGMLSLHLIATGHSSTKQVNTESLLQRGYLALVPPRTEFFSTCALRRKQRTPTTAGRKEVCVYTCSVCALSFSDFLDYTIHLTTSAHDRADKVPKSVRKLSASDYPEEIPVNEVMKCLICQSSFRTLKDLTMHMVHTKHYTHVPVHDSILYSKLGNKEDYRGVEDEEDMCIESAAAAAKSGVPTLQQINHPTLSPTPRNFRHHKDRNHRVGVRDVSRSDREHKTDRSHRGDRDHRVDKGHRVEKGHRGDRDHRSERDAHRGEREHKQDERHLRRSDSNHRDDRNHKEQRLSAPDDRHLKPQELRHRQRCDQWREESLMHFKERYKYDHKDDNHEHQDSYKHKDVKNDHRDDKRTPEDGLASSNTKQALNQMLASKRRVSNSKPADDNCLSKGLGKKSRSLKCIGCEHLFADVPKLSKHMKETGHYMMPPDSDDMEQTMLNGSSTSTLNGEYSHIKMAASLGKHHKLSSNNKTTRDYRDDDAVVKMEDYFADDSDDDEDFFNRNNKPEVEKLQEKVDSMFSDSSGEKDSASTTSSAPVVECVGKYVDPDNFDVVYPTGSRIAGSKLGSNPLGSLASMVETAKEMNFTRSAFPGHSSERWSRKVFDEPGCSVQAASEDSYKTAAAAAAAAAVAAAAAEAARSAAARAAAAARSSALVSAAASRPTAMYPASLACTSAIKKEWDDAKLLAKCAKKHKEDGLSNVTVAEAIEKILSSSFNFIKEEEMNAKAMHCDNSVSKRMKQNLSGDVESSPPKKEESVKSEHREEKHREDCDDDGDDKDCDIKDTDSRTESQSSTPCPMEQEDIIEKKDKDNNIKSETPSSPVDQYVVARSPSDCSNDSANTDQIQMNCHNNLNDLRSVKSSPEGASSQQVSVLCENRRVTRRTAKYLTQTVEHSELENLPISPPQVISHMSTSPKRETTTPSPKSDDTEQAMSETEAERNVVCVKRECQTPPSPVQNGAKSPESHPKLEQTISPAGGIQGTDSDSYLANHARAIPCTQSQATDLTCTAKIKIKQEPRDNTPSPNHNNHRSSDSPSKPLNNNTVVMETRHHSPHIKSSAVPPRTNKYNNFINNVPNKYNCPSPFTSSNSNPLQDLDKLVNSTTSTIQSPAPPKIAKFSPEVFSRRYVKRQQDLYINPASENHLSTNPLEEMDKMVFGRDSK